MADAPQARLGLGGSVSPTPLSSPFYLSSFAMRWTVPVPMPSGLATFKMPTPFASCFRTFRSRHGHLLRADRGGPGSGGARSCVVRPRRYRHNNSILDYVAAVADFAVARAAYRAACRRWPEAKITLRQGARVMERNWSTSEAAN